MNPNSEAIMSGVRTLLVMAGGYLAHRGYIQSSDVNVLVGALLVILPGAWGVLDKYLASRKLVVAVQAGMVAGAQNVSPDVPTTSKDAKTIIQTFAPPAS